MVYNAVTVKTKLHRENSGLIGEIQGLVSFILYVIMAEARIS